MPQLVSNMVDAYIFRRVNARLQFLLLLRRPDLPLGNTWLSVHAKILPGETAVDGPAITVSVNPTAMSAPVGNNIPTGILPTSSRWTSSISSESSTPSTMPKV